MGKRIVHIHRCCIHFKLFCKTLKTFIRESLILSSLFHWGNTEPWSKIPCCLPEREGSQFQSGGLELPGSQLSQQSLLLKQVEVGHELQLRTGTGYFQLEV